MLNPKRTLPSRLNKRAKQSALLTALLLGIALPANAQSRIAPSGALPASPWSHRSDREPVVQPSASPTSRNTQATVIRQPRANTVARRNETSRGESIQGEQIRNETIRTPLPFNQNTQQTTQAQAEEIQPLRTMNTLQAPVPTQANDSSRRNMFPSEAQQPMLPIVPAPSSPKHLYPEPQIETQGTQPQLEIDPSFDDTNQFTSNRSTSNGNNAPTLGGWERLPRAGVQLASDPNELSDLPGLPDRADRSSGNWSGAPANSNLTSYPTGIVPQTVDPSIALRNAPTTSEWDRIVKEQYDNRQRMGKLVSEELRAAQQTVLEDKPMAIEPPEGWRSIETQLKQHLEACDQLLRRQAVLSAREEVMQGMRLLFRALDQRANNTHSERCLDLALLAFKEEADFHLSMRDPNHSASVASIVAGHQTPALKGVQLTDVPSATAAQYYRHYSKDMLVRAANQNSYAADLFYAYGKCLEKMSTDQSIDRKMYLAQAAACYQASLMTAPNQLDSANQLGYVLIQLDRNAEAESYLAYSLNLRPTPTAFQNLAELYARKGDGVGRDWAMKQLASIAPRTLQPQRMRPVVQEVDEATFARLSPYEAEIPKGVGAPPSNATPRTAQAPGGTIR